MKGTPALASTGTVAIVGRPNVGKSALFNRLVGRMIAIVHDQPGITRDRLSALCTRGARPFAVWDTGGIGGAGEMHLRQEVRGAAEAAMKESDLILFVVDAQQGITPIDADLAQLLRRSRKPLILVVNKMDHPKHDIFDLDFARLNFAETVSISAAHGRGIGDLLEAIEKKLPEPLKNEEAQGEKPIALAIVGRPNVGKSSLINSVLRDQRTIVSNLAGTTRDAVDIRYERNGEHFTLIDTAGIRHRSRHSSSVEVFSVARAERTIRRADLCVLVIDVTGGLTTQDKKIAGSIQAARKPCLVLLNKWDLLKPDRGAKSALAQISAEMRAQLFFLPYAPILIASALTGENVERLFGLIDKITRSARKRLGTGVLNRLLRAAFAETPPPTVGNKRLKLFYAAQAQGEPERAIDPPKFVLFVNQPNLLTEPYARYLEGRIREAEPYPGLPVLLTCRARSGPREK
ncbi:MAG: ribosome biogenesis GTPase Der [Chthoniobacterales bacterium]